MADLPSPHIEQPIDAPALDYIETARSFYRQGKAEYRGRRNPEQQAIAELTAEEAHLMVDGVALGFVALASGRTVEPPVDYETEVTKAGFTWDEFRGEFSRLLVGFAVMTNRLSRDTPSFGRPAYIELPEEERQHVANNLFSDFLAHNALRFGVDASGVKGTIPKTHYTDDGDAIHERIIVDKDEARSEREIAQNMVKRKYNSGVATHPGGKISPAEYKKLRREFPEMPKDQFDDAVSFYTDVRHELETRE